jgi:hypothetical protein
MPRPVSTTRFVFVAFLCAMQVHLGSPLLAQSSAAPPTPPASPAPNEPGVTRAPAAPKVTVNRTVPKVVAPSGELTFRTQPSMADIVNARVFREPLVPVGGTPTDAENAALARALLTFAKGAEAGSDVALRRFLADFSNSPWRASLLLNLGMRYRTFNAYARALASWDQAWKLASPAVDGYGKAVADLAIAEWLLLNASLGQIALVQGVLKEVHARPFSGLAAARLGQAREMAGMIAAHPDKVMSSGPQALIAILQHQARPSSPVLTAYRPTAAGTSLVQLRTLAKTAGLDMRIAFRDTATEAPVPSVVHWKVGHYSAVLEREGNRYRIVDEGFAGTYWVTRDTLFDEASGYFLVSSGTEIDGWQRASDEAASLLIGRSCPAGGPPGNDCGKSCCSGGGSAGPPPGGPPPVAVGVPAAAW